MSVSAFLLLVVSALVAEENRMAGGVAIFATKNIVQNAMNSNDHATLYAALKRGGSGGHTRRSPANRLLRDEKGGAATIRIANVYAQMG